MWGCPNGDFYVVGLNELSVKKREASQDRLRASDSPTADKTLN